MICGLNYLGRAKLAVTNDGLLVRIATSMLLLYTSTKGLRTYDIKICIFEEVYLTRNYNCRSSVLVTGYATLFLHKILAADRIY